MRELTFRTLAEYMEIVGANAPHALVLDWWRRLKLAFVDYFRSFGEQPARKRDAIERRVAHDPQLGPEVASALSQLRRSRNTVAHEAITLAPADAAAYAEAAFWMIGVLTLQRPPHKIPAVPILGAA